MSASTSISSISRGRSLASLPAEILQHIAFEVALTTTTSSSSSSSSTTRPSSSSSTTSSTSQYIDPVITSLLQAAAAAAADKAKHNTKRRRRNTNRNNLHHHNQQYIPIPHHLPALLLTCSRFNNLLNINSNPSFYARLFRFHYDSSAIARRFGARAVTPQALAAEYRTRAQRAAQIFKPSDSISAGDHLLNLWTIYLLAIENDGRNAVTLHNLRALPYLDFLSASPSRPLFQPDRDYPDNSPEHALALHIRHLLGPLPSSAQAREALSNKLRPFVFAAHRFDAFVAPWTYEHLPVGTFSRYSFDAASHHDQPHPNHQQQHHQQQRRHHQAHQPAPQEVNNPYFTDLSLRDRHHAVPYCGGILHLSPPNAVLPACQMFFGLIMQQQLEQEEEEVWRGQATAPSQQHHQQQQHQDGREGEEGDEDDDGSDSSHSHSSSTATASAHELALDDFPTAGRNNGQYVGAITANAIHEALITGNITLQQLFEALQAAAETVSLAAAAAADSSSSPSAAAQDPSTTSTSTSSSSSSSPSTSTSTTSRPTTTATTTPSWGPSAIGPSAAAIAAAAVAASTALQDSSSYLNPALSAALTSICEDLNTKASQVASLNGSKRHLAVSALIADDSRREERARAAVAAAAAAAAAVGSSSSVVVVPASGKKAGKQRAVEDDDEEEEEEGGNEGEEEEGEEVDSREVAESDHAAISRALSQALNLIRSSDSQLLIRPAAQQEEEDEQQSMATATDTDTDTDTDTGEVAPAQQEQQRRRRRRQPDSTGSAASSLSGPSSMTAQTPLVNLWPSSAHDGDVRRLISCLSPFISPGLPSPASLTLPLDTTNTNTSSRRQQPHTTTTTTGSTTGSGVSGLQGTWEGQFAFFDFDSYRDMLSGRVSGLFDGQYGEQAQVWKLEEKVVRVSRKKAVVDWERERRWGNEVLAVPGGWEAGRLGGMVEEGDDGDDAERPEQEAAAGLGEDAAGSGAAAAAVGGEEHEEEEMEEEVDEVLISGVGHSAWGHFILRGRIRAWDGLVTLVKEYRPDGRGRWRYRGYLVAGDRLVGRWRDTFSPPHMSGYEGCFLLRRREGLLVHV